MPPRVGTPRRICDYPTIYRRRDSAVRTFFFFILLPPQMFSAQYIRSPYHLPSVLSPLGSYATFARRLALYNSIFFVLSPKQQFQYRNNRLWFFSCAFFSVHIGYSVHPHLHLLAIASPRLLVCRQRVTLSVPTSPLSIGQTQSIRRPSCSIAGRAIRHLSTFFLPLVASLYNRVPLDQLSLVPIYSLTNELLLLITDTHGYDYSLRELDGVPIALTYQDHYGKYGTWDLAPTPSPTWGPLTMRD
jgi:hypothetical protein